MEPRNPNFREDLAEAEENLALKINAILEDPACDDSLKHELVQIASELASILGHVRENLTHKETE